MDINNTFNNKPGAENAIQFKTDEGRRSIWMETRETEYILSINLKDLEKKDIDVQVEENMLIISSSNDTSHIDRIIRVDDHCLYDMHQLHCRFAIPADADANSGRAEWKGGKLFIHFPRIEKPYRPSLLKIFVH